MALQTVADLAVRNYGSVVLIEALSETGRTWLQDYTQAESWQWFGDSLAVEPRCVADIMEGAADDGLSEAM